MIGIGHVARSLSLATELRGLGANVVLVSRNLGLDVTMHAEQAGIGLIQLPFPSCGSHIKDRVLHSEWMCVDWEQDADETVHALTGLKCKRVIVDHYSFDWKWHDRVGGRLRVPVAAIDDLGDRQLKVDFLIDHNLNHDHHAKYAGLIDQGTRVLGGPRYALVGKSYARLGPINNHGDLSVGIFMGGVDAAGLSLLALKSCRVEAGFVGPIEIATTSSNPHLAALGELAANFPHTKLLLDEPDLSAFFSRHTVQIGAGGGACWERCCAGAAMVLLVAACNQEEVVKSLVNHGAATSLPDLSFNDAQLLGALVKDLLANPVLRKKMSESARELVDGLGARRVALALLAETVALRPAQETDCEIVHPWRNHLSTRLFSRDMTEVPLEQHRKWWTTTIADCRKRLLLAHVGIIDIGVLRFDIEASAAEVSIYLNPAYTRLGLGTWVLLEAQRYAIAELNLSSLYAFIVPGNLASETVFTNAGFKSRNSLWTWEPEVTGNGHNCEK
jgi:UDP-2,4-diacetamido-2,4,6-trideoxy-beta-L-altropyranose hydrolase